MQFVGPIVCGRCEKWLGARATRVCAIVLTCLPGQFANGKWHISSIRMCQICELFGERVRVSAEHVACGPQIVCCAHRALKLDTIYA